MAELFVKMEALFSRLAAITYFHGEMQHQVTPYTPALLLVVCSIAIFSCGHMKAPEPRGMEEFRVSRFGLKQSTLELRLGYYNPNKSGITLKSADGDAWIDNEYVGHFSVDSLVRIHARDDFSLPLTLQVEMNQVLKTSSAILFGKIVSLKLEGKAKLRKGGISFSYPIRYEGKQDLSERDHQGLQEPK